MNEAAEQKANQEQLEFIRETLQTLYNRDPVGFWEVLAELLQGRLVATPEAHKDAAVQAMQQADFMRMALADVHELRSFAMVVACNLAFAEAPLEVIKSRISSGAVDSVVELDEVIADAGAAAETICELCARFAETSSAIRSDQAVNSLAEVVELAARLARRTHRGCRIEVGEIPDVEVVAPRGALLQAINNLIRNAVHATAGRGEARVSVKAWTTPDAAFLAVEDNGPGLGCDPDKLFEPFQTTKVDGMGLGLTIVRELVVDWGGSIQAEDVENGSGARFILDIALAGA